MNAPRHLVLLLGVLLAAQQAGCSLFDSEEGCYLGSSFYGNGARVPSEDGCNTLTCEDGKLSGTLLLCNNCADRIAQSECENSGCTWLTACDAPTGVCRDLDACQGQASCAFPLEQTGSCMEDLLDDCSTPVSVCQPPSCWKARATADGQCLGPGGVTYDPRCCDMEERCTSSNGTWHTDTCGHYVCGVKPSCEAAIPGCDCGPGHTYVEGLGCAPTIEC